LRGIGSRDATGARAKWLLRYAVVTSRGLLPTSTVKSIVDTPVVVDITRHGPASAHFVLTALVLSVTARSDLGNGINLLWEADT